MENLKLKWKFQIQFSYLFLIIIQWYVSCLWLTMLFISMKRSIEVLLFKIEKSALKFSLKLKTFLRSPMNTASGVQLQYNIYYATVAGTYQWRLYFVLMGNRTYKPTPQTGFWKNKNSWKTVNYGMYNDRWSSIYLSWDFLNLHMSWAII